MGDFDINNLIERLLQTGQLAGASLTKRVTETEIIKLCELSRAVFLAQPSLLELEPPIRICGDIHGQYADLLRLFARGGFPPAANYLFLGDYVDRGKHNLETICLMLAYKVRYPENFFMLRGNHECHTINLAYGFYDECIKRYSTRLYYAFQHVFLSLPFTALVGGKILCMHGGLSQQLKGFDQLRNARRPMEATNPSIFLDLLWADPCSDISGYVPNARGVSQAFGADVVVKFCERMKIDMVARAHQVVQDGYEFFAGRRLVTIFSAPHYCGEFDNAAAMMLVDKNMTCSFEVLKPIIKQK